MVADGRWGMQCFLVGWKEPIRTPEDLTDSTWSLLTPVYKNDAAIAPVKEVHTDSQAPFLIARDKALKTDRKGELGEITQALYSMVVFSVWFKMSNIRYNRNKNP